MCDLKLIYILGKDERWANQQPQRETMLIWALGNIRCMLHLYTTIGISCFCLLDGGLCLLFVCLPWREIPPCSNKDRSKQMRREAGATGS